MKHKGIKKMATFLLAMTATCMLVSVDREVSLMNNRDPMLELSVIRVSEDYFEISFLGYSKNMKAKPIEDLWNKVNDKDPSNDEKKDVWQEIVLCSI